MPLAFKSHVQQKCGL